MRADPNLTVEGWAAADKARGVGHDEVLALLISNGGTHNIRITEMGNVLISLQ